MKKLTPIEVNACKFLARIGPYCPGLEPSEAKTELRAILDGLVKKRRVLVTVEDDGPVYSLTAAGEADAA